MAKRQMRSKSGTKTATKSDAIREVMKKQPNATAKEIKAALHSQGVKASDALINKLKYGRNRNGAAKKASRRKAGAQGSKAEAIRGAWNQLGTGARPRDVIALLASQGIHVASAQVSVLRKSAGKHRAASANHSVQVVPYEHLLAAKDLAARLGGIEHAQTALAGLAKLTQG